MLTSASAWARSKGGSETARTQQPMIIIMFKLASQGTRDAGHSTQHTAHSTLDTPGLTVFWANTQSRSS